MSAPAPAIPATASGEEPRPTLGRWLGAATVVLARAGVDTARLDARLIAADGLGWDAARVLARPEHVLSAARSCRLDRLLAARAARRPLAQVLGRREFWGLPFRVTADTLTPRPDSETVVEAALATAGDRARALRVLDLGTGSGCLLLALLSELPNAIGVGTDISENALAVAAENARRLGLDGRARFVCADWGRGLDGTFDLVLCNPPYVATGAMATLEPEVTRWEPRLALVAGADGFAAYRALGPDLRRLLDARGRAFLETGRGQARALAGILAERGLSTVGTHADLAGVARVVEAQHGNPKTPGKNQKKVGMEGEPD